MANKLQIKLVEWYTHTNTNNNSKNYNKNTINNKDNNNITIFFIFQQSLPHVTQDANLKIISNSPGSQFYVIEKTSQNYCNCNQKVYQSIENLYDRLEKRFRIGSLKYTIVKGEVIKIAVELASRKVNRDGTIDIVQEIRQKVLCNTLCYRERLGKYWKKIYRTK